MKYLENKIVIITGAGFSAPANLPIQDKILEEMMEAPSIDFMNLEPKGESIKFLTAFVKVACYLLKEYSDYNVSDLEKEIQELENARSANDRVGKLLDFMHEQYKSQAFNKEFNLSKILDEVADRYIIDSNEYCVMLLGLKERLRRELERKKIRVSLEDIFTSFDKSINTRENTMNYTYTQMDGLQHSILRLFVYYFSEKTNEHSYQSEDYLEVINFIKNNIDRVSVITTNWDVLLERYLLQSELAFDYKFNSDYVIDNNYANIHGGTQNVDHVNLMKIHGSINWFRCLRCGTLQVCNVQECGQYLFDDLKKEKCNMCGQVAHGSSVQMQPEIITPTMLKTINGQLYNNIWQNAAYELQNADKVIFCGYSLPTADFEFRYLLKQNINPKASIDIVLYHNDDPNVLSKESSIRSLLPERRYKDLFSNNECVFYYEGFGKYFADMNGD